MSNLPPPQTMEDESDQASAAKVVTSERADFVDLGSFGARFLARAEDTQGAVAIVEHPIPPRTLAAPLHRHSREDEYSYVIEGTMGAQLGSDVVEAARRNSPFLAQALAATRPRLAESDLLELTFGPEQAVFREGTERQRELVATIVSARMGRQVRVSVGLTSKPADTESRSARLTAADLRAERLKELRRLDPALDAAADALDLELVDDD